MIFILISTLSLLIGALLCLIIPGNLRSIWISIISQGLATLFSFIALIPILNGGADLQGELFWSFPVNRIGLRIDALGAFFLAFSLPMTLLGTIYARGYLAPYLEKKRHFGPHFAILNLISLSYILIYTVENALVFLLGWEIAAISAWLAVIWDYKNQKIRFAGFNYLISTHLSLLFLIAAFMILRSSTGTFDFEGFRGFLGSQSILRNVTFLLFMTSFGLKSAFFPFHTWLPRAHSAAPAHISSLMSGVIHKAGIYGILRFTLLLGIPERWMGWTILAFTTISAVMGVLYTITQRDIKRLLGYSSTENVGIIGIGIGIGYLGLYWHQPILVAFGFSGAILHVLNHALFKCLLFYAAGAIYRMTHTIDLERLGGLIRKMPQTAIFFLLGGLGISALPLFNGFVSEFLIYQGLFFPQVTDFTARGIFGIEAVILAIVGAISAISITRVFGTSFLGSPRDTSIQCLGEVPSSMKIPMIIHSIGVIMIGLFPILGIQAVMGPLNLFLTREGSLQGVNQLSQVLEKTLKPLMGLGLAIILVVMFLWILRRRLISKAYRTHCTWGCGYTAINARMQYTGSSFSALFLHFFQHLLSKESREKLPMEPFPQDAFLNTTYVDSIERRIFKVLGAGEETVQSWMAYLTEEPCFAFRIGLLVLILIGLFVVGR